MTDYSKLVEKYNELSGTPQERLAVMRAATVPGARVDVEVPSLVGTLMLSGAYLKVAAFAAGAPNNDPAHDAALGAAKVLMAIMTVPNPPHLRTTIPANHAAIKGMVDAILAYDLANPGATGISQAVHDELLALCETTQPWATAPVEDGGAGLTSIPNGNDLVAAGLIAEADAF